MSPVPFPGDGHDGEQPLPASGSGNEPRDTGDGPVGDPGDEEYLDRLVAAADAGRIQIPGPAGQGLTISLAGVTDPATADLAGFAEGGPADTMAPGAVLTALADAASGILDSLTDNQVLGIAGAGKRIAALGAWIELAAAAQFAGRHKTGDPPGQVAGETLSEFAGDELAPKLGLTPFAAAEHLAYARTVTRRLPATFAALRAGAIDDYRVKIIAEATQWLPDADAAEADQVLAISAAELTYGRLRSAAARLVMMLDPEAAKRRKDEASKNARVSLFREEAGTAGLSGRDLPVDRAFASFANVKARAAAYQAARIPGTITELRSRAFLDLLAEQDARDALRAHAPGGAEAVGSADQATGTASTNRASEDEDPAGGHHPERADGNGTGNGQPPLAALINITVPLATLLGTSTAPGEAAGFGFLDPAAARDLAALASRNPATRWCLTVIGPDGTAYAHGCAFGHHPYHAEWGNPRGARDGPGGARDGPGAGFLPSLKIKLATIAKGDCGHARYERGHDPSRALAHLIRARSPRCTAPGCGRPAARCDLDHTQPWEHGGPTCECNIGPLCRHHHRCKQSHGWHLEQPAPGVMCWKTPAGRHYITRPCIYYA